MRAIIFILLKIAEIAAVIFIPYLTGLIHLAITHKEESAFATWGVGAFTLICILFLAVVVCGLIGIVHLNLDLSKKLNEKFNNILKP